MPVRFLIPRQKYLASGIHIGMKQRTKGMKKFVYKVRPDGLAVLNLKKVDKRIRVAAKFLARNEKMVVVARKDVAKKAAEKFAEIVDAKAYTGRFMPGTLTNPDYDDFYEAEVVLITDPLSDYQALKEALTAGVPVVAICDTFNELSNIDLAIPSNNKGKRALATLYWLLAREILKERGEIKSDREFEYDVKDFLVERKRS